ncbi:MAG: DUF2905 domain-containing protein [Thermodesulfobacteriota bacterium]|jgi:hypothetical protein|nr:MAG: DUF2905 domain-containing protein [Thermodesulfobacteriota bacterium]
MTEIGKLLLILGIILSILGLIFIFGAKVPGLGRLPGDIFIKKGNITFFFPIVTCILISIIVTLILSLFRR